MTFSRIVFYLTLFIAALWLIFRMMNPSQRQHFHHNVKIIAAVLLIVSLISLIIRLFQ